MRPDPALFADAFADALRPHYDDAVRYCRALCATWAPHEAEDVLQAALLRAYEGFGALRDRDRFRPWLFRTLTRTHATAARRHTLRRLVPFPADAERELGLFAEPTEPELALRAALARLGRKERAALLLYEVAGLSVEEVREAQGDRTASAVKVRLHRARARLRDMLAEPDVDGAPPEPRPSALPLT